MNYTTPLHGSKYIENQSILYVCSHQASFCYLRSTFWISFKNLSSYRGIDQLLGIECIRKVSLSLLLRNYRFRIFSQWRYNYKLLWHLHDYHRELFTFCSSSYCMGGSWETYICCINIPIQHDILKRLHDILIDLGDL